MKTYASRSSRLMHATPRQETLSNQQGQSERPPGYGLDFADNQRQPIQRTEAADSPPTALAVNRTGLPDKLKAGVETLSGYSMDDVRVHYNSGKPAQLQALAYAQGTEIHIGPGQEEHLPHETWHVVQQMDGRVRPTRESNGQFINDNPDLETEAEQMGQQATQAVSPTNASHLNPAGIARIGDTIQRRISIDDAQINWGEVKEIKSLKLGKVLLVTDGEGNKLVLKVERAPFAALEAAQTLLSDISMVKTPKIRELGYNEQMQLNEILRTDYPSIHKMFMEELASELRPGGSMGQYVYVMEFIEGEDLEGISGKDDDGWKRAITRLTDPELQNQLGQMHAIDLFVGNKDRGLINLGNWKIGADGNIIALDNADANSYANRYLTQAPTQPDHKEQMNIDFTQTLNKLSDESFMRREAKFQFEGQLPSKLNANNKDGLTDEIRESVKTRLAPYDNFINGMKAAGNMLMAKLLSMGAYNNQAWGQEAAKRASLLSSGQKERKVVYE